MDFQINTMYDRDKDRWQIKLEGEVDIFNSDQLKKVLFELTNVEKSGMDIDCKYLEYLDSTALGALVTVLKTVRLYDGDIHLTNVRPSILKIFRITDLDKVFAIEGGCYAQ